MSEISSRALLNALYAIRGEIASNGRLISSNETSDDEHDAAEDYILELNATFGEFAALYKARHANNASLPSFDSLFEKVEL
jgi:hypothetical protein